MSNIHRRTKYLILFLHGCSCRCCGGFGWNFRDIFKIHEVCDISDNVLSHSRLISSLYLIIAVLGGPCLRQSQGNRQRNSQETSSKWLSSNNEKLNTRTSFASEQSNEFDRNKLTTWQVASRSMILFYLRLKGRVCWKWSIWSSSRGAPRAEEARESTTNTQKHFIIDRIWVSGIIVRPRLCLFSTRVELRRWATQVMSSAGRAELLAPNSARNHFSCSSPVHQPTRDSHLSDFI